MAEGFDYGALWNIARDALDAVNALTSAIIGNARPPLVHPSAVRNPSKAYCEKYWAELKTLPERRAKAGEAIRKAAEKLDKLLAEDRYVAPLAGVWPPHSPKITGRLSYSLKMAKADAHTVADWKDDAHINQSKRSAVNAQYTLQAIVTELERRPEIAKMAYQRRVDKLQTDHPDWSADEALATWQSSDSGNDGNLIERLLTGPDDVELTSRELALLEAYLKQPYSPSTIQHEKRATGRSGTLAKRNKLTLIRDFNRNLQAAQLINTPPAPGAADDANPRNEAPAESADTTPKKPGRKKADYETVQREAQLAADWERAKKSGVYKPVFAKEKGMTTRKLDNLLGRVAKRKSRSDK
ncbi:MAG: hypothetical protein GX594_16055 [Pirellulaceae bacterium]|nr:hypothetical protein [Pirellulaceae bacterium]